MTADYNMALHVDEQLLHQYENIAMIILACYTTRFTRFTFQHLHTICHVNVSTYTFVLLLLMPILYIVTEWFNQYQIL